MDVVAVEGTGGTKLQVLFDGKIFTCYNDTNCHGAAICAINETWMVAPGDGMCMCNTRFGLEGYNCNQLCSHGIGIVIVNVFESAFGLALFLVSLYLAWCLWRKSKRRQMTSPKDKQLRIWGKLSPVTLTVVFTTIGSLFFTVSPILSILVSVCFPRLYIVDINEGHELKRTSQAIEYVNSVFFAIAYNVTLCTFLLLPLAWIDVAQNSLRLRPNQTSFVIGVSLSSVVIILGVLIPFFILLASRYRTGGVTWVVLIIIAWAIIFPVIIFLNLFALWRITIIKRANTTGGAAASTTGGAAASTTGGAAASTTGGAAASTTGGAAASTTGGAAASTSSENENANGNSREKEEVLTLLTRIQISAVLIIITSIVALALGSLLRHRSFRGYYSDPRCFQDSFDLGFRSSLFFVEFGCAVVVWFIWSSASKMPPKESNTTENGEAGVPGLFPTSEKSASHHPVLSSTNIASAPPSSRQLEVA